MPLSLHQPQGYKSFIFNGVFKKPKNQKTKRVTSSAQQRQCVIFKIYCHLVFYLFKALPDLSVSAATQWGDEG